MGLRWRRGAGGYWLDGGSKAQPPPNSLGSRLLNSCFEVLRVSVQHLETVTFAGGKGWDEWRERLIDSL